MSSNPSQDFLRIPLAEVESRLIQVLIKHGFASPKAKACASVFIGNSLDGVYSHGVNRFIKFIDYVKNDHIQPNHDAICKHSVGSIEQWDGQSGP